MRKVALFIGILLSIGFIGSASAAKFEFHGDFNNRFMLYTDQAAMLGGSGPAFAGTAVNRNINKDGIEESWGDIKYRLWAEAASDDGKIKGVYAIELGALRFGNGAGIGGSTRTGGGGFSGDGINVETRWAYTDFQIPGVERKARVSIGLIPFKVNDYFWSETAMGVQYKGAIIEPVHLTLAWVRGVESFNNSTDDKLFADLDALTARVDFKVTKDIPVGLFAVYQGRNPSGNDLQGFVPGTDFQVKTLKAVDFDLYTFGADGRMTFPTGIGNAFLNWDLIYQGGSLTDNSATKLDINAWFAHADVGVNIGDTRLTYTTWYSSGDDNPGDDKIENYLSTDIDMTASRVLMESYTDDNYFTESTSILDKGLFLNKLALDHKATKKLTVGVALLYLQTAEDLTLAGGKTSKKLGTEIDAYLSYKLFPNTTLDVAGGYLFADDAMDFFEVAAQRNGTSDTNIVRLDSRLRYTF
jgi:hypothetical protein